MKNREDFFDEDPPAGHAARVMKAAEKDLQILARDHKRGFWSELLTGWRGASVAGGLAAVFAAVWFFPRAQREMSPKTELELVGFQESFGTGTGTADIAFLADETTDLEMLENLDLLEEMEDV
jgi:hypothetical protein